MEGVKSHSERPMLNPSLLDDAGQRIDRFPKEIHAMEILVDSLNEIIVRSRDKIKLRPDQPERDLDLLVAVSFGKASKSFQAINNLCAFGFGEDSLVVVRANLNLMINLAYILAEDSLNRSGALIAYSHKRQIEYLRSAHDTVPDWYQKLDWEEIDKRAARWEMNIKERAEKARQSYHYQVGYKFYSSIEHSDVWSLSGYIAEWDEVGPKVGSGASDKYVSIALNHNFWIMANILSLFCSHFGISEPEIFARIDEQWKLLATDSAGSEGTISSL